MYRIGASELSVFNKGSKRCLPCLRAMAMMLLDATVEHWAGQLNYGVGEGPVLWLIAGQGVNLHCWLPISCSDKIADLCIIKQSELFQFYLC